MGPEKGAMHCIQRLADYQNSVLLQGLTDLAKAIDSLASIQRNLAEATDNIMDAQKRLGQQKGTDNVDDEV